MSVDPDPLHQLRFVWDERAAPDIDWLRAAFIKYFEDGHTLPLERCMGLPTTKVKLHDALRNRWLCEAARYVDAPAGRQGALMLRDEWDAFVSRGPWRHWRDDEDPPTDAPRMDRALFYATKHNSGDTLCARQLRRIVGHIFTRKSPSHEPTL